MTEKKFDGNRHQIEQAIKRGMDRIGTRQLGSEGLMDVIVDELLELWLDSVARIRPDKMYRPLPGPLSAAELASAFRVPEDTPLLCAVQHVILAEANLALEDSRDPDLPDGRRHFHAGEESKATEIFDRILKEVQQANTSAKSEETKKKGMKRAKTKLPTDTTK
ncbi:MAG: hypothetical protein ACYTEQ_03555 [Planctomycetota bacterium]|jgi:hypothetical protein